MYTINIIISELIKLLLHYAIFFFLIVVGVHISFR